MIDDIYKLFRNPPVVDDVYQAFQNGNLLGSFGDFLGGRPVAYFTQPMMFTLPQAGGSGSTTEVLAFRVWMEPFTLTLDPNVGGLRTVPLLGEVGAVAANYKLRWLKNVLTHADYLILAPVFVLLALGAFSLTLERVLDLVRNSASAAAIATAAQNFGQEDDISVIAITRTAA